MDASQLLEHFFSRACSDARLAPRHVAVFASLVILRSRASGDRFLLIPSEVMCLARIQSRDTYHRTLRELHDYGYILYAPSHAAGRTRVELVIV